MMKRAGTILAAIALCAVVAMPSIAVAADAQVASQKDETVYVYADATGSVKSTEVSTLLKNDAGATELKDSSNLTEIKGKDDVKFTGSGDSIIWAADGKSVTYTGKTTVAAPISLKATYTLDGVEVSPEQLAGKSGHVTIRYEFTNHSQVTSTVNGDEQTVYTPFTCITAIMLDGKDFKNVTVENCKVVNDGDDMVVAGYALPGLKESLGSMADDATIPEHFSISADVTGFELKSTMTIVTAGIMSDFDADSLGISAVGDASALTEAMGQLINGSSELTNGLNALAEGAQGLEDGAVGIQLGAQSLSENLNVLAGEDGLTALSNYEYSLASAIGDVNVAAEAMRGKLETTVQSIRDASGSLSVFDNASAIMSEHETAILESGVMTQEEYQTVMLALGTGSAMPDSLNGIADGLESASGEIDKLESGIAELKAKAESIASGISTAADSASQLAAGAEALEGYATQLAQAAPQLTQGLQQAADGSKTLTEGMQAFNDQGVSRLVDTLQNDYGGMLDRMNALSDAAKSYTNFGGITPGTEGTVKFVIEVDAIAKE